MPPRQWKLRITDILDAIAAIQSYTKGMNLQAFQRDQRTIDAVIRNITVIGEAARMIPLDLADHYPEIPWEDMRDMRNVVVHVYFGVNTEILWDTAQNDLPSLSSLLKKILGAEEQKSDCE